MTLMKKNLLLLLVAVLIIALPLIAQIASEYPGADVQAQEVISEINPDYQPWFSSVFILPGSEVESMLFALQAALGAGVLGFGLGRITARPTVENSDHGSESSTISTNKP